MPSSIVLTGATTGIGRATALRLAGRAGHLVLHGLEPESRVADLLGEVRAALPRGGTLSYLAADFSQLVEAERLVSDIRAVTDRVDLLVNNAARPGPASRTVTDTGYEVTFQTNYSVATGPSTRRPTSNTSPRAATTTAPTTTSATPRHPTPKPPTPRRRTASTPSRWTCSPTEQARHGRLTRRG